MMLNTQIDRLQQLGESLFNQVDERVKLLESRLTKLQDGLGRVRAKVAQISSPEQRNKATCLYSTPNYPMEESDQVQLEPISFDTGRINLDGIRLKDWNTLSSHSGEADNTNEISKLLRDIAQEFQDPFKLDRKVKTSLNLNDIKSASSLLVFYSHESRLIDGNSLSSFNNLISAAGNRTNRSIASGSSEFGVARSHRQSTHARPLNGDIIEDQNFQAVTSASNELGPAPSSILKYHQDSFIDVDMLDTLTDGLNLNSSSGADDLLTSDLPDLLPSLSGVILEDVSVRSAYHHQPTSSTPVDDYPAEMGDKALMSSQSPVPPAPQAAAPTPPKPPPPPPPPPPNFLAETSLQNGDKTTPQVADTPTRTQETPEEKVSEVSGRSALMAEIRSAASKPKPRANRSNTQKLTSGLSDSTPGSSHGGRKPNLKALNETLTGAPSSPSKRTSVSPPPPPQAPPVDPRDSLLASIRSAAGRPTKKANPNTVRRQNELRKQYNHKEEDLPIATDPGNTNGGGDLMNDLISKLRARRDGISGRNQVGEPLERRVEPLDTVQQRVLTQVSLLIPEIPADKANVQIAKWRQDFSDCDDNDDDDEWNN